jgi:hypothetical protein
LSSRHPGSNVSIWEIEFSKKSGEKMRITVAFGFDACTLFGYLRLTTLPEELLMKKIALAFFVAAFALYSVANADTFQSGATQTHLTGPSNASSGTFLLGPGVLYDNGAPDGTNGYSNGSAVGGTLSRFLMDDFVVTGSGWNITDFHFNSVWNSAATGLGTGINLEFWSDNAGSPDSPIATANVNSYSEVATGGVFFSRPEVESSITFDPITLGPGTYWVHAQIIEPGGDNNFWLISNNGVITGSESWVDWPNEAAGPLFGPVSTSIGAAASDLNFRLTGTRVTIPEPASVGVLALGTFMLFHRRRR